MPSNTQKGRRSTGGQGEDQPRRRRRDEEEESEESGMSEAAENGDVNMGQSDEDQMVKKLVRYVLACEYSRTPIKRDGIRDRVLGSNSRVFKRVFDGAQKQLRFAFGMEMAELPTREKRTLREKQKATQRKSASQASTSSRTYILISTLPNTFKAQPIIGPSCTPSTREEAEYAAIYTTLISLISLAGGELSDHKLKRSLARLNSGTNMPMDRTDNVLAKLVRQGYLERVVEKADGNQEGDTVTWCVGQRGRVEVPPQSIASFVSEVYGADKTEDFKKKLHKSLGLQHTEEVSMRDAAES